MAHRIRVLAILIVAVVNRPLVFPAIRHGGKDFVVRRQGLERTQLTGRGRTRTSWKRGIGLQSSMWRQLRAASGNPAEAIGQRRNRCQRQFLRNNGAGTKLKIELLFWLEALA